MTISDRLRAIREGVNDLDIDTLGKNVPIIEDNLDAIQASIDSAETDAGKLAYMLDKHIVVQYGGIRYLDIHGLELITAALLSQREKYDALIAKAEGDAEFFTQDFLRCCSVGMDGGIEVETQKAEALFTAALLKAGQRECSPHHITVTIDTRTHRVVPLIPDENMYSAAVKCKNVMFVTGAGLPTEYFPFGAAWSAMLAAAPEHKEG